MERISTIERNARYSTILFTFCSCRPLRHFICRVYSCTKFPIISSSLYYRCKTQEIPFSIFVWWSMCTVVHLHLFLIGKYGLALSAFSTFVLKSVRAAINVAMVVFLLNPCIEKNNAFYSTPNNSDMQSAYAKHVREH